MKQQEGNKQRPNYWQWRRSFILEIRTGNFSKSVTLWTPLQTWTFCLRVSVTHRPALARLILGRWKERSSDETSVLASCTRNIQTNQRNQKHIPTHWHPVQKWKQRRKTSFTRNPPGKKKKGKSTKEANSTNKSWTRMNSEQRRKRKRNGKKNSTNRHGKTQRKERKNRRNGTTTELPTNTSA